MNAVKILLGLCVMATVSTSLAQDPVNEAEPAIEDPPLPAVGEEPERPSVVTVGEAAETWLPWNYCRPSKWLIENIQNCVATEPVYVSRCVGWCPSGAFVNWGILYNEPSPHPHPGGELHATQIHSRCECCKPSNVTHHHALLKCTMPCQCGHDNCQCDPMEYTQTLHYNVINDCDCSRCEHHSHLDDHKVNDDATARTDDAGNDAGDDDGTRNVNSDVNVKISVTNEN